MRRRALLSLAATASLGGCSSLSGRDVRLDAVSVLNLDERPRSVRLRVESGGEEVHASAHELDAAERSDDSSLVRPAETFVSCTWPRDAGRFTVAARLDGGDGWEELDLSDDADESCYVVTARVDRGGRLYVERRPYCEMAEERNLGCYGPGE